ncbi:MAG: hypothetical protein L5656_10770 [Thermanaeromonas sp.]|uniref:hypothetical protein n=1 Tax=Thermanaeromonas sp. TaxID=2003697 RepID=UPI00243AD9CC|nr:hypothetical protein [Thermanaeromonas sp.]MCG0278985.1 hypothetical protein [Thermanaeromonas sp.]
MNEKMQILDQVLRELLSEADTALAALDKIASVCPSVLIKDTPAVFDRKDDKRRRFCYPTWIKDYKGQWVRHREEFACFVLGEDGSVESYRWGQGITNPGGLLAAMLRKEKERLGSVAKLADVPDEMGEG